MAKKKDYRGKAWRVAMLLFAHDRNMRSPARIKREWARWHPIVHTAYYERAKLAMRVVRAAETFGE